jgi:hypothetical protein
MTLFYLVGIFFSLVHPTCSYCSMFCTMIWGMMGCGTNHYTNQQGGMHPIVGIPIGGSLFPLPSFCTPPPWPPHVCILLSLAIWALLFLFDRFSAHTAMLQHWNTFSIHISLLACLSSSTSLIIKFPNSLSTYLHTPFPNASHPNI